MKTKAEFLKLRQHLDEQVRKGRITEVRSRLRKLSVSQPVERRLPIAQLCRRVGLNEKALKVLSWKVIKPIPENLPLNHLPEYALNLQRIGSVREAIRVLSRPGLNRIKGVQMSLAYCYMSLWDYEAALQAIERHIALDLDSYQRAIAQVNQVACLITLQNWELAEGILKTLSPALKSNGWHRLLANAHELKTQALIGLGKPDKAAMEIELGLHLLRAQGTHDSFFLQKWQAVIDASRTGEVGPINKLKLKAKNKGLWETVRDLDYQSLRFNFDSTRRDYLYFGSRSPMFKRRIAEQFGLPEGDFYWNPHATTNVYNLAKGILNTKQVFKPGQKVHQTLTSLTADFYRPLSVGGLFSDLYPEQYFDIFSSPDRVHQVLKRTRQALSQHNLGIILSEVDGKYMAKATHSQSVVFDEPYKPVSQFEARVIELKEHFLGEDFSAKQAAHQLNLSHSNTNRLLKKAVESDLLVKKSQGPKTKYSAA